MKRLVLILAPFMHVDEVLLGQHFYVLGNYAVNRVNSRTIHTSGNISNKTDVIKRQMKYNQ